MNKKLQLAVLCGGVSTEHEISILSARNVTAALNPDHYDISVFYITQQGQWYRFNDAKTWLNQDPQQLIAQGQCQRVTTVLGDTAQPLMQVAAPYTKYAIDCFFPVLHGTYGEDGSMQGLLDVLGLPYVGPGVLGSAICMEKQVAKSLLRAANLPTVDWVTLQQTDLTPDSYQKISKKIGSVCFVKPAGLGSSVGVSKIKNQLEFDAAVAEAFQYDDCILVERAVIGREIEVSVLGNQQIIASLPGEIITPDGVYSYDAKYLDPDAAKVVTPASLSESLVIELQQLAIRAFQALQCFGMARVDFFLDQNDDILINELNTIPGFTNISMYPKNWEASGISYSDLLDRLVQLALERHQNQLQLVRTHQAKQTV